MANLIENRKAYFNYEIIEKYEAGIELFGFEVKSLRKGQGNIDGAYISVKSGEALILGMSIPPFQPKNAPSGYDPERTRKLLIHKKEIKELIEKEKNNGLTLVPLSLYNKGLQIKLSVGVARGKKKFDKRETIKKRENERDLRRTLK